MANVLRAMWDERLKESVRKLLRRKAERRGATFRGETRKKYTSKRKGPKVKTLRQYAKDKKSRRERVGDG